MYTRQLQWGNWVEPQLRTREELHLGTGIASRDRNCIWGQHSVKGETAPSAAYHEEEDRLKPQHSMKKRKIAWSHNTGRRRTKKKKKKSYL